jgi:DNA-binding PadR family transcriptional regulator
MEFLTEIKKLYEATRLPVHYKRVAELLGVSKWSAYEMLKKLEKQGLLSSRYQVNQGEKYPGRAMVLFAPTALLEGLLARKGSEGKKPNPEWLPVKEKLLKLFQGFRRKNSQKLIEQLMDEISHLDKPMVFNAYFIALLVLNLQTFGKKSIELVRKMVLGASNKEIGLSMFAGTIIGSMLKSANQLPVLSQMSMYISKFQENWADFNESDQALLVDFFQEALEIKT